MKFTELKKQNKNTYAIATVVVETGIDGGWQICLQTVETVKYYIDKLKEIKKADAEIWCGILRNGDYLTYNDLIDRLDFQIVTKEEADILNKYNVFNQNYLCLTDLIDY